MRDIDIAAADLSAALLRLAAVENVCILDSGGVGHLGSHLMIAGVRPVRVREAVFPDAGSALRSLDRDLLRSGLAAVLTLSYGLGEKLHRVESKAVRRGEPDVFIALFDCLVVHDYESGRTFLTGNSGKIGELERLLRDYLGDSAAPAITNPSRAASDFSREEYIAAVERIKRSIRAGSTYQTNLTQKITIELAAGQTPEKIFAALRISHPAAFGAYIRRLSSTIVSASPERHFKISGGLITASPIKGTRPRGTTAAEDRELRDELISSEKDRAENTMIVDLTRNDLGRLCEYGSVTVDSHCEIEAHPTLFHLVSTVTGRLRSGLRPSEIITATFPCGSITGAPKLSTMKIIAGLETSPRGLSMGSIGINIPAGFEGLEPTFETNVAIRTMVIRGNKGEFNVGGGIVIDSDPAAEYDEALLKAKALLTASDAEFETDVLGTSSAHR